MRILSVIIFTALLMSCGGHKAVFEQWKELDEFHDVMSQTFHPSEDGDLAPIKARAGEMASKAKVLADSKVPSQFSNPKMKETLQKLVTGSEGLANLINTNASDAEITSSLSDLHDVFHTVMMLCRGNDS